MNTRGMIIVSRIIGVMLLLLAIMSGGVGLWFYSTTKSFLAHAVSVSGVVTDLKPSLGGGGTTYATEFEFADSTATKHRLVTTWSSSPAAYGVGDRVEVLYPPGDPSKAELRNFMSLWVGAIICAVLSALPLFFGLVFIWLVPFIIDRVTRPKAAAASTSHQM